MSRMHRRRNQMLRIRRRWGGILRPNRRRPHNELQFHKFKPAIQCKNPFQSTNPEFSTSISQNWTKLGFILCTEARFNWISRNCPWILSNTRAEIPDAGAEWETEIWWEKQRLSGGRGWGLWIFPAIGHWYSRFYESAWFYAFVLNFEGLMIKSQLVFNLYVYNVIISIPVPLLQFLFFYFFAFYLPFLRRNK